MINMLSKVVGVSFNDNQSKIMKIFDSVEYTKTPILLQLVREPNNPYDSNAIKVGEIGYLSKDIARDLAPLMDKGLRLSCRIQNITHNKGTLGVNILIRDVTTEIMEKLERGNLK